MQGLSVLQNLTIGHPSQEIYTDLIKIMCTWLSRQYSFHMPRPSKLKLENWKAIDPNNIHFFWALPFEREGPLEEHPTDSPQFIQLPDLCPPEANMSTVCLPAPYNRHVKRSVHVAHCIYFTTYIPEWASLIFTITFLVLTYKGWHE